MGVLLVTFSVTTGDQWSGAGVGVNTDITRARGAARKITEKNI